MKTRLTNHGINTDQLVAFDLETTGVDPDTARIVTGSLVHFIGGLPMKTQSWLADPGIDIPAEATAIHGITTEHARENGRDHDDVAREIADAITADETLSLLMGGDVEPRREFITENSKMVVDLDV